MKQRYSKIIKEQRDFLNKNIANDIKYRKEALSQLKETIKKYENNLYIAFEKDLNKNAKEAFLSEISQVFDELELAIKKINKWTKTKKVKSNYTTFGSKTGTISLPRGIAFIISPFNYPVNLSMIPLISSIAAGNSSVLKFSVLTPNINKVLEMIIADTFDQGHVAIVTDDDFTNFNDIYKENIDMMFFTGSTETGKKIQLKCAEFNIPYVLELGGKSPAILEPGTEDKKHLLERIVWGKLLNGGQTCVAPDYFLVQEENVHALIHNIKMEIDVQYPNVMMNSNLPKIINEKAFHRLTNLLQKYQKNIIHGGSYDEERLLIEPTIILLDDASELKNIEEVFGPIFFITTYTKFIDAVTIANEVDPNPLAAYLFTNNNQSISYFVHKINSLNIAINDVVVQISNPNIGFGGIKTSGTGKYHGKFGFETFSIQKNIMNKKININAPLMFSNKGTSFVKTKSLLKKIKKFIK